MAETLIYPPGSVIIFTAGKYSDLRNCGAVVAARECDLRALAQQFWDEKKSEIPEGDRGIEAPYPHEFPSWLVVKGHAMPLDCSEVHLGDWCSFDDEFGVA